MLPAPFYPLRRNSEARTRSRNCVVYGAGDFKNLDEGALPHSPGELVIGNVITAAQRLRIELWNVGISGFRHIEPAHLSGEVNSILLD
jgi:hypothetical protein